MSPAVIREEHHEAKQMTLEKAKHSESTEPSRNIVDLLHKRNCPLGRRGFKTVLAMLLLLNEFLI